MYCENKMFGEVTPAAEVESCHHHGQHWRQHQNQTLRLQMRYAIKALPECDELFWIGTRQMLFRQALVYQMNDQWFKERAVFKYTQRPGKYFQSGERLEHKEEQVADKKGLQRRHIWLATTKKKL